MKYFFCFSFLIAVILASCTKDKTIPSPVPPNDTTVIDSTIDDSIINPSDIIGDWKISSVIRNGKEWFNVPIVDSGIVTTSCGTQVAYYDSTIFYDGPLSFNDSSCFYFGSIRKVTADFLSTINNCTATYNDFTDGWALSWAGNVPYQYTLYNDGKALGITVSNGPNGGTSTESFTVLELTSHTLKLSGYDVFSGFYPGDSSVITFSK